MDCLKKNGDQALKYNGQSMNQSLALTTFLVSDYDEAIDFFTQKLGFELIQDRILEDSKRWVVVGPKGGEKSALLLAKATGPEQIKCVGNQTGGRVFLFLHTDNFWRDYKQMSEAGINFKEKPRTEVYGTVVVFEDLYGNLWDLMEPKE